MTGAPAPVVDRFRRALTTRVGLTFDEGKTALLGEVLLRRAEANGLPTDRYVDDLERSPAPAELGSLAGELTVGETYFFRHTEQLQAFVEVAIPQALAARGRVSVLSAGCSTGEEPYTLAMLARSASSVHPGILEISAFDLNPSAIRRARAGRYAAWALRETPIELQRRWFREHGRDAVIDDEVRHSVRFEERNLAGPDPAFWVPGRWDVVFCRNVLMYFDPGAAAEVIARITAALTPGGYLFLGHAETLRGLSNDYHLCHTNGAFYYRRKGAVEAPRADTDGWAGAIQRASDRVRALATRPPEGAPVGDPSRRVDLTSRLLDAVTLFDRGAIAYAAQACDELLALDELNAGAHYVLALCREASGDRRAAIEHNQMAAYLDRTFAMPRLHLGLLLRRSGDLDAARRELGQALVLLDREEPARLLLFGGGFGRDNLLALCRAEISACGGRP